jgi:HUS1 checkpoint protein
MRFKAKLATEQVSLLHSVIAPMAKVSSDSTSSTALGGGTPCPLVVIYLDPQFIRISTKGGGIAGSTCCFAELKARDGLFLDHRIESAADDVIVLQVDVNSLKMALASVLSSSRGAGNNRNGNSALTSIVGPQQHHLVVMKLAKRSNLPCLCLDGTAPTSDGSSAVEIHQAIPVRILRSNEMQHHLPPQINMPNVQLELCSLDRRPLFLKGVVDKLRAMGSHILLEASMKGDLTIRLDHEGASLACFYHQLVPRWDDDDNENTASRDDKSRCTLKVDSQKLWMCLQWQQPNLSASFISSCLMGMVENEMLVLHILLHPASMGFFTYYIPVHFLRDDEDLS